MKIYAVVDLTQVDGLRNLSLYLNRDDAREQVEELGAEEDDFEIRELEVIE